MPSPSSSDRGSVTAETAVLLPELALLLAFLLSVARAATSQLNAQDAARLAARAAARGESSAEVERLAGEVAPRGAVVTVRRLDGLLRVEVTAQVRPLGAGLSWLPAINVGGSAVAAVEPASRQS